MVAVETVALTDPAARDPSVAGVKAAGLAAAAAAGLPVLPGRVLPLEASAAAIAAGVRAFERSGRPSAYLAATGSPVPPDLEGRLSLSTEPGDLLVVRSSTGHDDDGRWAGAFTSYLGVEAGDIATAVRGCWASAFSGDALGRCGETGVAVEALRVGVLVQPFLRLDAGGTARVRRDGAIDVSMARGGPAGVVGGRRGGIDAIVGTDGTIVAGAGPRDAAATVAAAAALARRAAATVAAEVIEWGAIGDELYLLQIGPIEPVAPAEPVPLRSTAPGSIPAGAERLARLLTAFPGPVADELVIPWALGAGEGSELLSWSGAGGAPAISVPDPRSALLEARTLAGEMAARVWGTVPAVARDRAAAVSRLLLQGRVDDGLRAIADLPAPDAGAGRRVVGLVRGVGEALAESGLLPSARLVWGLSGPELDRAIDGVRPPLRSGPGRWEPFVADVVRSRGRRSRATPVSPGVGAGPVRDLRSVGRPAAREVLVTSLPLPHLAPLLWHSAALVTAGGTSGAHLFEVARALGVPAVIGADLDAVGEAGSLVAVDGDTGLVSVVPGIDDPGRAAPTAVPHTRAMV